MTHSQDKIISPDDIACWLIKAHYERRVDAFDSVFRAMSPGVRSAVMASCDWADRTEDAPVDTTASNYGQVAV